MDAKHTILLTCVGLSGLRGAREMNVRWSQGPCIQGLETFRSPFNKSRSFRFFSGVRLGQRLDAAWSLSQTRSTSPEVFISSPVHGVDTILIQHGAFHSRVQQVGKFSFLLRCLVGGRHDPACVSFQPRSTSGEVFISSPRLGWGNDIIQPVARCGSLHLRAKGTFRVVHPKGSPKGRNASEVGSAAG